MDFQGVIRGLDLTSQPRLIQLPMVTPSVAYTTLTMPADPPALILANIQNTGATIGFAAPSALYMQMFLFSISADAVTVGQCEIGLYATEFSTGGTVPTAAAAPELHTITVSRSGAFGPSEGFRQSFSTPLLVVDGTPNAASTSAGVGWIFLSGSGGMQVKVRFSYWVDAFNRQYPGPYGSTTGTLPSQTEKF